MKKFFKGLALAIAATLLLTPTAFAQADSTDTSAIYLGVNAGAAFLDPETDESEFQLTGAVAYLFPVGLYVEYEGGAQGGGYAGWTRAGWAVYDGEPVDLILGIDNLYDGSQNYGAFASAYLTVMEGRALRGTFDANYNIDIEEFGWGARLGFYLVR